jgi:hypothetical protein
LTSAYITAVATASQMTRAVPRDWSPTEALSTASAAMPASAGVHAARPGMLTPPVGGDTATKTAIPQATLRPPMMPFRLSGSRFLWAIIGSANRTSVATSGWTRASGPKARATAWIPNARTVAAIPPSHRRWRANATSNPKRNAGAWVCLAAPCWSNEPSAKQKAAHSAATTAIAILMGIPSRPGRVGTLRILLGRQDDGSASQAYRQPHLRRYPAAKRAFVVRAGGMDRQLCDRLEAQAGQVERILDRRLRRAWLPPRGPSRRRC